MATLLAWIIVAVVGIMACLGLIGLISLIRNRWRREKRGDIFLLKRESTGKHGPVELRAQRDYRYKDAGVDPYTEEYPDKD